MKTQKELVENFIKEYEDVEKLMKDMLSQEEITDWEDESLLMYKRIFKMVNAYKEILIHEAEQNDYLVNTITDINNKLDKLVDRAEALFFLRVINNPYNRKI